MLRLSRQFWLAMLTVPLGGCVAAAIPVVAAGGLMQAGRDRDAPRAAATRASPAESVADSIAQSGTAYTVLDTKDLPAPGSAERQSATASQAWDVFYGHAMAAANADKRHSAFLADPGLLSAQTAPCGEKPPAVLIDLDPAGGTFDANASGTPSPHLAQVLAALRGQSIAVAWISGNFADAAPAIRQRLQSSGLDPAGDDELLLLRYRNERKQERRMTIAETHCLVAIAGDERSDFDELFAYLKNPDAAVGLEPLLGTAWFVTPNPLN